MAVAASLLVVDHPDHRRVTIRERLHHGLELDSMPGADGVAVVAIDQRAVPCDLRITANIGEIVRIKCDTPQHRARGGGTQPPSSVGVPLPSIESISSLFVRDFIGPMTIDAEGHFKPQVETSGAGAHVAEATCAVGRGRIVVKEFGALPPEG